MNVQGTNHLTLEDLKVLWLNWNGFRGTAKQIERVSLDAQTLKRMLSDRGVI